MDISSNTLSDVENTNLVSLLLVAIILRVLINSYDKQDMVEVIQSDCGDVDSED